MVVLQENTKTESREHFAFGVEKVDIEAAPIALQGVCHRYAPGYSPSGWYQFPFSSTPPQKTNTSPFICCTQNAGLACKTATTARCVMWWSSATNRVRGYEFAKDQLRLTYRARTGELGNRIQQQHRALFDRCRRVCTGRAPAVSVGAVAA